MAGINTYIPINDRYRLVYDSLCMWIEEYKPKTKKGTARKDPWERVSGYHRSITGLVESFELQKALQIEEVGTLQEMAEAQKRLHAEVRELCEGLKNIGELRQ